MVGERDYTVEERGLVNEYGDGVAWFRGSMIGKGSFGRVYLATLKNPGSKYSSYPSLMAVKSAEVSSSGSIQKEREVLSNVRGCPDIIRCFGEETTIGDNGAVVYNLLLEYGSGGTLAERIKQSGGNGLSEFEVKVFTRSILRGLNHIHESGYVHCDLKPDNILLVPDSGRRVFPNFRAKIADFGLAKRAKQSKKRKLEPYWRGTPLYLSPEAVLDKVQDPPCDIWALGCIVLQMLTGKPPWNEKKELSADEILTKIGRELPKIPNEISKDARDFLKGCFVRKSMFRLTAEMLLNHSFVEGLGRDDADEEVEVVEDLNDIESILLVSESDGEFSCDSSYYWSEGDEEEEESGEDEIASSISEDREVDQGVIGYSNEAGSDQPNTKLRKVTEQVSSESRQHCPVSFTVPAALV